MKKRFSDSVRSLMRIIRRSYVALASSTKGTHFFALRDLAKSQALLKGNLDDSISGTLWSAGFLPGRPVGIDFEKHSEMRGRKTCGILGSGTSLNNLNQREKALLDSIDLITFNNSHLAPFRPKFHVMQFPLQRLAWWRKELRWEGQELLERNVWKQDSSRLQGVFVFRRTSSTFFRSRLPSEFERWVVNTYPNSARLRLVYLPGHNLSKLGLILDSLRYLLEPWSNRSRLLTLKPGSSLPMCVLLAANLGYEQIVLAGCDLKSRRHFYDESSYQQRYDPEGNSGVFDIDGGSFTIEELFTDGRETSPIDDLVQVAECLDARSISKVFLVNDDSRYFPRIPVFPFE